MKLSHGMRYFVFSAAFYVGAMFVVFGIVRLQETQLAAAQAVDHLTAIGAAQRIVEQQQTRDLALRAQMIASNQAVVSYLVQALDDALPGMEVDYASVKDLLDERRQQLGLSFVGVADIQGRLVASTGLLTGRESFKGLQAFETARRDQTVQNAVLANGHQLMLVAIQPLAAYGTSEAYLLVGMPVDQAFAKSIADVGSSEVVVLNTTGNGAIVVASTLKADRAAALLRTLPSDIGGDARSLQIDIDGAFYRGSVERLFDDPSARLLALVPPERNTPAAVDTRVPIRVGAALVLFVLIFALALFWLRVVSPLHALRGVIEYAAVSGDLNLKAPTNGARPVRRLAEAFNQLCQRLLPSSAREP